MTKPQQQIAPFLRDQKEPKKIVRYRALFGPVTAEGEQRIQAGTLHRTEKQALDEAVAALAVQGILRIEEVPVKRKQHTTYEEVI